LNLSGRFYLLLPFKRNEEIKRLLEKHELDLLQMTYVKQSFLHDHFRIMLTGQLNAGINENADFDELSIWDENKNYTTEFAELLKSYYLYL
jgi:tRNA1(Val) A37 N6-methylase TrmN6